MHSHSSSEVVRWAAMALTVPAHAVVSTLSSAKRKYVDGEKRLAPRSKTIGKRGTGREIKERKLEKRQGIGRGEEWRGASGRMGHISIRFFFLLFTQTSKIHRRVQHKKNNTVLSKHTDS